MRLGDIIDDHCSRCARLTDHSVVAIVGEAVKKVRCRTCSYEHDYRHGKGASKKKAKLSPYEEVLAAIMAGQPGAPPARPEQKKAPERRPRATSLRGRVFPKH